MPNSRQEHQLPFDKFEVEKKQTPNVANQVFEPKYPDKKIQPNSVNIEQTSNSAITSLSYANAQELEEQHLAAWQETNTKNSQSSDPHEADTSFRSFLNTKRSDNEYDLPEFLQTAWNRIESKLKKDLVTSKTTWNNASNSTLNLARQELAKSIQHYINQRLKELAIIQEQTVKNRIDAEAEVKATQKLKRKMEYVLAEEKRLEQAQTEQEQAERRDKQMRDRWKYWFYIAGRSRNIIALLLLWGAICFYWGGVTLISTPKIVVCNNRSSPCYYLRYWGIKYTVTDLNKIKNSRYDRCKRGMCNSNNRN